MFFSNRTAGGKDKFRVSCGQELQQQGAYWVINREFTEHHLATSERSPLRSEMATLMSDGERWAKSSLST